MRNELYDICRMKVLYVDDDFDITLMVRTRFAKNYANQVFITASNGKEAIELAQLYNPDLFIIDLNMPIINGIQLMKQLQHGDNTKEIAAISVCTDDVKISDCIQSGFRYFIRKPIDFTVFFEQIDSMMERIFWKRLIHAKSLHYLYPDTCKLIDPYPSRRH